MAIEEQTVRKHENEATLGHALPSQPTGVRAAKKRSDIIDAALSVLLDEGAETNLDRVAAVANVSKVTIYNHFKTKDALLVEVVKTQLRLAFVEAESIIRDRLGEADDLRATLKELCRAWVSGLRSQKIMALRTLVAGQAQRVPELGSVWIEVGPVRLHRHIASAFERLVERNRLKIDDLNIAVLQLAGLVVSPHIMYGPFGGGPDDMLTERLIEKGLDIFLHEYATSAPRV